MKVDKFAIQDCPNFKLCSLQNTDIISAKNNLELTLCSNKFLEPSLGQKKLQQHSMTSHQNWSLNGQRRHGTFVIILQGPPICNYVRYTKFKQKCGIHQSKAINPDQNIPSIFLY